MVINFLKLTILYIFDLCANSTINWLDYKNVNNLVGAEKNPMVYKTAIQHINKN